YEDGICLSHCADITTRCKRETRTTTPIRVPHSQAPLCGISVPRMPSTASARLPVLKTYKLYIGGKFPRGESGRVAGAKSKDGRTALGNYCVASRKDFRDSVVAARKAQPGWAKAT